MKPGARYIKALLAVLVLIAADQLTKHLAVVYLKGKSSVYLIKDALCFRYLENNGSAFSLMQGKQSFLILFTIAVLAVLVWLYLKVLDTRRMRPLRVVLVMICAGAAGNFIDRISQGYVVDFIYFELINFPVFNVADIFVTVGAALLVVLILFYYKDSDFDFLSRRQQKADR